MRINLDLGRMKDSWHPAACQWLMIIQLRRNPVIRLNTDAWLEVVHIRVLYSMHT